MSAWKAESVAELLEDARRLAAATETCPCPDEPHQNALHDLAQDLVDLLTDPEPVECEHCGGSGNTKVHVKGATVDAPCTPCGGQGIKEREL